MDRVTRWCGIALLGSTLGCGSPDPASQGKSPLGAPESSGTSVVEATPISATVGSPSSQAQSGAKPLPLAATATPDGEAAVRPSASERSQTAEREDPSSPGASAVPPREQLQSWAAALAGNDVQAREAATEMLQQVAASGLQPLLPLLQDASPLVRRGTLFYLLDRYDPADVAAGAALSKCLTDPDASVRSLALSAAARFPPEGVVQSLPQLIAILSHPQERADSRAAAARLIGTLDRTASDAIPALVRAASGDPDPSVRSACVLSICRTAPEEEAVTALRRVLKQDARANLRGLAAARLGKLGSAASSAASDLGEALADFDEGVRRKAADALASLGPAAVAPSVQKLDAPDVKIRRLAVFVLAKLGADAKPALDALRQRLQDSDAEVKQLAALAVSRIEVAQAPGGNR